MPSPFARTCLLAAATLALAAFDPASPPPKPPPPMSDADVALARRNLPMLEMAARRGSWRAMRAIALASFDGRATGGRDMPRAVALLTAASAAGDIDSMRILSNGYHFGFYGLPRDYAKAMEWTKRDAETGDPLAISAVGTLYKDGDGQHSDPGEAVRWFRRSADAGSIDGMNSLGLCLLNGIGVERNTAEGIRWLGQAAGRGQPNALMTMAQVYMGKNAGPSEPPRALASIALALTQDTKSALGETSRTEAATLQRHLQATLSPADLARAAALQAEMAKRFDPPAPH